MKQKLAEVVTEIVTDKTTTVKAIKSKYKLGNGSYEMAHMLAMPVIRSRNEEAKSISNGAFTKSKEDRDRITELKNNPVTVDEIDWSVLDDYELEDFRNWGGYESNEGCYRLLNQMLLSLVRDYQDAIMKDDLYALGKVDLELKELGYERYRDQLSRGARYFKRFVLDTGRDMKPGTTKELLKCPNCHGEDTVIISKSKPTKATRGYNHQQRIITRGHCVACGIQYTDTKYV